MVSAAVSSQCAKRRHTAADDGATAQCVDIDDERQVTSVTVWAMASTRRGLDATASLPGACRVERAAPQPLSDAQLARFAVDALIDEAELTPKPALVDGRGSGAHRDLDLPTMRRSARALESTFEALARAARQRTPSAALRAELAEIGREGEQAMMRATGGSNAHRGAIWIVGLMIAGAAISGVARGTAGTSGASASLGAASFGASASSGASGSLATASACAVASLPSAFIDSAPPVEHADSAARTRHRAYADAATVCSLGAQIACFPDRFAAPVDSHGERARQRYQVGGARREAQDGFPHALDIGLPALAHARERGIGENAARVDALLAIMASLDDTCLLHRAGLPGLQAGQRGARRVLAAGGSSTAAGRAALSALDRALVALNASPGGAADLLAATLFLDKLSRQDFTGSTASWNT